MTTLQALLADPTQDIAFVLSVDGRDPVTDTITTYRWQTANRSHTLESYPPYLSDPGTRDDRMQVDELEAVSGQIANQSLSAIILSNQPTTPSTAGPLDSLISISFSGRPITLYAGHPDEAFSNYGPVAAGVVDGEPGFDGSTVEFRRKSALTQLDRDFDAATYVGEPGALRTLVAGTGLASTGAIAAHSLTSYTVAGRFRVDALSASTENVLSQRRTASTNETWNVHLRGGTAGAIRVRYSSGGVAGAYLVQTSQTYVDGEWHDWVFARSSALAYLMVDGVVVVESVNPPTPDAAPTAGTAMGLNLGLPGDHTDLRVYSGYISPSEMVSAMEVRASGDEVGLVALWRGDDQTGSVLTDYSTTAAHAAIAGTENTDFEWVSSDLGVAESAGQSQPVILGDVFNAPADLVDPFRERWRLSDRPSQRYDSIYNRDVKDQGEVLTDVTDYDWPAEDPVFELTAAAGEPVTVDIDTVGAAISQLRHVLRDDLLIDRGGYVTGDIDLTRLESLYPTQLGIATRKRSMREVVSEIVNSGLGYAAIDLDGDLRFDALVPPTSPSPRDGACLDIASSASNTGQISWSSALTGTFGDSLTLACWVKSHAAGPSDLGAPSRIPILESNNMQLYIDTAYGVPRLRWSDSSFGGDAKVGFGQVFQYPGEWFFIAAVNDQSGGQTRFYSARYGQTLTLLGTSSAMGYPGVVPLTGLTVAGGVDLFNFRGSIVEPQVWQSELSLAQLQALMAAPPSAGAANLLFYASLYGDSAAALTDVVSSTVGAISGDVRQVPDLTIDLTTDPHQFTSRNLRPAHEIEIGYRRNYKVMSAADIAATVSPEDAIALKTEYLYERWRQQAIQDDYLDSRTVVVNSLWSTRQGARAAMRQARYRYAVERQIATLSPLSSSTSPSPFDRLSTVLRLGDEVRVYGERWGLDAGLVYRVISNRADLIGKSSVLGLFR